MMINLAQPTERFVLTTFYLQCSPERNLSIDLMIFIFYSILMRFILLLFRYSGEKWNKANPNS